jgi:hypothetical protein
VALPFQQIVESVEGVALLLYCYVSEQVNVVVDVQLELKLNWEWLAMSLDKLKSNC